MSSPFLALEPYRPHPFERIREGVLPTAITPEAYAGWVRKFDRAQEEAESFRIEYDSGGHRVNGLYLRPREAASGSLPLILFNRGGRNHYGMLNVLTINNLLTPLVQRGYLVLASNYRGVDGGGGQDEFGGEEVADILHLLEAGRVLPQWDGKNIYMFGWSRGGMMTLLALKHGAEVSAAAMGAPLVDLTLSTDEGQQREAWLNRVLPDYAAEGYRALERRSAPYWLDRLGDTPLLLMHGDADRDVSVLHSRQLAQKLAARGHPHRLVEYAGGNHYLNSQREAVMEEIDGWFREYRE